MTWTEHKIAFKKIIPAWWRPKRILLQNEHLISGIELLCKALFVGDDKP